VAALREPVTVTLYLSEYQSFNSIEELNHHVDLYRHHTTATQFRVLWFISRFAVKYPGAAHLKAATIAEGLGISTKTVYRALKSLADIGAIVKYKTIRPKSGGQGANIYVIQPIVQATMSNRKQSDKPCECKDKGANEREETAQSINLKNRYLYNTYSAAEQPRLESPYARFKTMVNSFVANRKLTNRLYGIYLAQTSYLRSAFDSADLLDRGLQAIIATFQATKRKRIRNIAGYYNGTLDRMLDRLYFESVLGREFV
jgi:DNA-binding Lrp family transcriptional regulator